jgi:hypothetical protein
MFIVAAGPRVSFARSQQHGTRFGEGVVPGLPALEDKIVQKGIAWILEAIYEADFWECSYGFRPKRNCHQAVDAVDKTIMQNPINHVIDADRTAALTRLTSWGLPISAAEAARATSSWDAERAGRSSARSAKS